MVVDAVKVAVLLFVATVTQVTIVASIKVATGRPDLVLVMLVAVALLRGSIFGTLGGFWAGVLLDTADLATLGVTSLLLGIAGYWIGRYGETTGRDRAHAPFLSVAVVTLVYAVGDVVVHFMLGQPVSARDALIDPLPAAMLLNLALTLPVYRLCRRLLVPETALERSREVELVG